MNACSRIAKRFPGQWTYGGAPLSAEEQEVHDSDVRSRARLTVRGSMILAPLLVGAALFRLTVASPLLALPSLVQVAGALLAIVLIRRGHLRAGPNVALLFATGIVGVFNISTHGRMPGPYFGGGLLALVAVLITGPRVGGLWAGAIALSMATASWLAAQGGSPPLGLPASYGSHLHAAGLVLTLLLILVSLIYEGLRAKTLRELVKARHSALDLAREKADFLATMSHEIRTPLAGMIGMTRLLAEQPLEGEARVLADTLARSSDTLLRVINGVLDLSKLEAGAMTLEQEAVDLHALGEDVMNLFSHGAPKPGVALTCTFEGDTGTGVMGDRTRLQQVLTNLVGNALKFTSEGKVELRIKVEHGATGQTASFAVVDTGIGLSPAQVGKLFGRYQQAEDSTARKFGGTGLGLAISQQLVGVMGGQIEVDSELGKGSCFRFQLQLPRAALIKQESAPPHEARPSLKGRFLVADDNAVNRMIAERVFAQLGAEVVTVCDGVEALDRFQVEHFDCVFLDLQMPNLDGYGCARAIRAIEMGKNVPIISLTASTMGDERQLCEEAGMNDCLSKPLQIPDVTKVLGRLLGKRAEIQSVEANNS